MTQPKFKVLDLFSGIGGFSLGLERTGGFDTVAFCEVDEPARRVLRKHWPDVPIFEDVQQLTVAELNQKGIRPDVIVGGFPCQDISVAGRGDGIDGERSGLWSEYARLICEVRPRYAIVENVSALLVRGLDRVLGQLAQIGYDAEWHCIPASSVGAPHRRDRVWIIAHCNTNGDRQPTSAVNAKDASSQSDVGNSHGAHGSGGRIPSGVPQGIANVDSRGASRDASETVADSSSKRPQEQGTHGHGLRAEACILGQANLPLDVRFKQVWSTEPAVGRVAHGVPKRMDRLKQLGNAVVPQIPELIGQAILDFAARA